MLLDYGCGITAAVSRATPRAADLTRDELAAAVGPLAKKIRRLAPNTIAFLGKAAYAAVHGPGEIAWGRQDAPFGGANVWVLPHPSGLNRGFSLDQLVVAYAQLRHAVAQVLPAPAWLTRGPSRVDRRELVDAAGRLSA